MPFDIVGARQSGATDDQIKSFLNQYINVDQALTAYSLEQIAQSFNVADFQKPAAAPPTAAANSFRIKF